MGLQKHSVFWVLLALFLVAGCGPTPQRAEWMRKTLIQNATTQIPCIKEFHEIWPMGSVDVFTRQLEKGTTIVQATEIVHDRYELTLTIKIEASPTTLTIKSYGSPLITLLEITSVVANAQSGQIRAKYGNNYQLSPNQWRSIVQGRGVFSFAEIPVKTNEPLAEISEYKERVRSR